MLKGVQHTHTPQHKQSEDETGRHTDWEVKTKANLQKSDSSWTNKKFFPKSYLCSGCSVWWHLFDDKHFLPPACVSTVCTLRDVSQVMWRQRSPLAMSLDSWVIVHSPLQKHNAGQRHTQETLLLLGSQRTALWGSYYSKLNAVIRLSDQKWP